MNFSRVPGSSSGLESSAVNVQLFHLCPEAAFPEFLASSSSSSGTVNGSTEDLNALPHLPPTPTPTSLTSHNSSTGTKFPTLQPICTFCQPICARELSILSQTVKKGQHICKRGCFFSFFNPGGIFPQKLICQGSERSSALGVWPFLRHLCNQNIHHRAGFTAACWS